MQFYFNMHVDCSQHGPFVLMTYAKSATENAHTTQQDYDKRSGYQHFSKACLAQKDLSLEDLVQSVPDSRHHMMPCGITDVTVSVEITTPEGATYSLSRDEALKSPHNLAVFKAACSRVHEQSPDSKLGAEAKQMLDYVSHESTTTSTTTVDSAGVTCIITKTVSTPEFWDKDLVHDIGVSLEHVNDENTIINLVWTVEARCVVILHFPDDFFVNCL